MPRSCPKCNRPLPMDLSECPYCSPEDTVPDKYGLTCTAGDIIGNGFSLWAAGLGPLILIFLIPLIPTALLGIAAALAIPLAISSGFTGTALSTSSLEIIIAFAAGGLILFSILFGVYLASQAGALKLLHEQALFGRMQMGVIDAFKEGFQHVPRMSGAMSLLAFGAGIIFVGFSALAVSVGPIVALPALVTLPFFFWLLARWIPLIPIIVLDQKGVFEAFDHAATLTQGHRWSVFGGLVLFMLIAFGIAIITMFVSLFPFVGILFQLAVNILLAPLSTAIFFAIYGGLKDAATPLRSTAPSDPTHA